MLIQGFDEGAHEGENISIIGRGGQNDFTVAERVLHALRHIIPGQIADRNLRAAFFLQLFFQYLYGLFSISVNGGIENGDAFGFYSVGRPDVVEIQIIGKVFLQDRAVQGTDGPDLQGGSLFQDSLRLCAVFSDDAEIVSSGFAGPAFRILPVQSTEFAEGIRGKENVIGAVISHQDFRPVNHRGGNETKRMGAEGKLRSLGSDDPSVGILTAVEIFHHGEGFGGSHDHSLRVFFHKERDIGGMIRFHMLDDQVIRRPPVQGFLQVAKPFIPEMFFHRVHDGNLIIQNYIGIIGHAQGDNILAFEKIDLMIVDTDIADILCHMVHHWLLLLFF